MPGFGTEPAQLERFASTFTLEMAEPFLPSKLVAEVVQERGRQGERRRSLPAELVAWLVVAAGLWRAEGLSNVLAAMGRGLFAGLRWAVRGGQTPGSGAITRARERLGVRPMFRLLRRMAENWFARHGEALRWRGMALVALDGTALRMPDSPRNRAYFGTHRSGPKGKPSAYPFANIVVALCAISHVVLAGAVGRSHTSEWTLVRRLLGKLPKRCLLLMDRGFLGCAWLQEVTREGHDFVVRFRRGRKLHDVRQIGPGEALARIHLSSKQRKARPDLDHTLEVRAITYQRPGFPPVTLLTSLKDPLAFTAEEIVARYRDRWEIELTFDEVKTHLLVGDVSLRSKSPRLVWQEIAGVLVAHNLVRMHMGAAAAKESIAPHRLSYTDSLVRLRDLQRRMADAPARRLPGLLADAHADIATRVLPPRRTRCYPRVVKANPCRYPIRRRSRAA